MALYAALYRAGTVAHLALTVPFLMAGELRGALEIPAGTGIYGELDERVTSRKAETEVGQPVRARVWRDVEVDGQVVIAAGAPLRLRVSKIGTAKMARTKGRLELQAVSVTAVDGSEVLLDGGYDRATGGRKAGAVVAMVYIWPLLLTKGKQTDLGPGVIFDAFVQTDTAVEVRDMRATNSGLEEDPPLAVEVMYRSSGKERGLPLKVTRCGEQLAVASVVSVNGGAVPPIPLVLGPRERAGDCLVARGSVKIKALGKHFRPGINRFEVEAGEARTEVLLRIEY